MRLSDPILPIIYRASNAQEVFNPFPSNVIHKNLNSTQENQGSIRSFVASKALLQPSTKLVGREFSVLNMEWALTKTNLHEGQQANRSSGRIVILHGSTAVGKTAFVNFLASWWLGTCFVKKEFSYIV